MPDPDQPFSVHYPAGHEVIPPTGVVFAPGGQLSGPLRASLVAGMKFSGKRNALKGVSGEPIGEMEIGASWIRQKFDNGSMYYEFGSPSGKGPFWVEKEFDSYYQPPGQGDLGATGGPGGILGGPTGDTVAFDDEGGRFTPFEHAHLFWWPDVGVRALPENGQVAVEFTNLHCSRETSNDQLSAADEPYVIFAVIGPDATTTLLTTTYGDVDAGDNRTERMVLYAGSPAGLAIGTVLREWDMGNPQEAKKAVEETVDSLVRTAGLALKYVPGFGQVLLLGLTLIGLLADALSEPISKALDLEDDTLGAASLSLTAKSMVLGATDAMPMEGGLPRPLPIGSLRFLGDGGDYTASFGVRLA